MNGCVFVQVQSAVSSGTEQAVGSGKSYTDDSIAALTASLTASISTTRSASLAYTDASVSAERASARAYTDTSVAGLSATVSGVIASVNSVTSIAQATSTVWKALWAGSYMG